MSLSTSDVMAELESLGTDEVRRAALSRGAPEPVFGVKVADLKAIAKRIDKDHALAMGLWDTGNSDARYLAGLIADEDAMTPSDLQLWVHSVSWFVLAEDSVARVAAETPHAWSVGSAWVHDSHELVACAGWATLTRLVANQQDEGLNRAGVEALLDQVVRTIHNERNHVRVAMNDFVIAVGTSVEPLYDRALAVAMAIGTVLADHGTGEGAVRAASEVITKARARGPTKKPPPSRR
jgi:3-methyladenine DNA glycosylase AlkD